MGRTQGLSSPGLALLQLGSKRRSQASWFPLPEVHTGLIPLCTSHSCNFLGKAIYLRINYSSIQRLSSDTQHTALWPGKQQMESPGIVLPAQWLSNSQNTKVWQWAGHFHHSSDLPQVFSEKQYCYLSPSKSLCWKSSSKTWTSRATYMRELSWPTCLLRISCYEQSRSTMMYSTTYVEGEVSN